MKDYQQRAVEQFIKTIETSIDKRMALFIPSRFSIATCILCRNITLWINKEIVYPRRTSVSPPKADMNEDIKSLYYEAATILNDSPKGSTALLRLALQKLLKQVGKDGKNINNDIKELESLYSDLVPDQTKEHINKRDEK